MRSRQQAHHYYSVFIDVDMRYFGFNERAASWAFYQAIRSAERMPDARAVDLRRDGENVASVTVNVKTPAIA